MNKAHDRGPERRPESGADGELRALTEGYCNGTLDDEQFAQLERLLIREAGARAFFRRYLALDAVLRDHADSAASSWSAPQRLPTAPPPTTAQGTARGTPRRTSRRALAVAAAAVALCTAAVLVFKPERPTHGNVAVLEQVSGDVRVLAGDGQARAVATDTPLSSGDTVRTRGSQSSTVLAYPDGTRLTLVGDTSVTCGDLRSGSIVVHQGTLAASVRPQPRARPMVLATPCAQVQVLGTRLLIAALAGRTDLSVSEGRVRLVRIRDGQSVEVPDGKYAVVTEQNPLLVHDVPALSATWEAGFEGGLQGWDVGEHVTEGLPAGSRGEVKPARKEEDDGTINYTIRSNDGWLQGLFAVRETSHLRFTFKIDKPTWVNIFVVTRTPDPNDPRFSGNYWLSDFPKTPSGGWQTVSIPLAEFKRIHAGTQSLAELVPYRLVFVTPAADSGLVIDRVWITPDGPGEIEVKSIE